MIAYSDDATVQFYLNDYKSREEVSKAILKVKSNGGITNTHLALQVNFTFSTLRVKLTLSMKWVCSAQRYLNIL